MSNIHNKLQYGNNYYHWKMLYLVLDLNYYFLYEPSLNANPTHLPKHQTLRPNHQFSQRIWYVKYYSVHANIAWSQKFCKLEISLDTWTRSKKLRILQGWLRLCGHLWLPTLKVSLIPLNSRQMKIDIFIDILPSK